MSKTQSLQSLLGVIAFAVLLISSHAAPNLSESRPQDTPQRHSLAGADMKGVGNVSAMPCGRYEAQRVAELPIKSRQLSGRQVEITFAPRVVLEAGSQVALPMALMTKESKDECCTHALLSGSLRASRRGWRAGTRLVVLGFFGRFA
jgi:hypothetical protein